jgi:hypothetical protein
MIYLLKVLNEPRLDYGKVLILSMSLLKTFFSNENTLAYREFLLGEHAALNQREHPQARTKTPLT